jgi:hypothetical protein
MNLDRTPSNIQTSDFGEWLDYCVIGAEEMGLAKKPTSKRALRSYDRPLTERQYRIRQECREAIAERGERA